VPRCQHRRVGKGVIGPGEVRNYCGPVGGQSCASDMPRAAVRASRLGEQLQWRWQNVDHVGLACSCVRELICTAWLQAAQMTAHQGASVASGGGSSRA
jgi:hypothetical protein